jgi:hypothetical protein
VPKATFDPNAGGGGGSNIEPLESGQYPGCVLEKIAAFRQRNKDEETGKEFTQTKLSLYWNSGYVIDSGEPYYFTQGFMTLSFHERANFAKMLEALEITKAGDPVEVDYEFDGDWEGRTFDELPLYAGTGPKRDSEVPLKTLKLNGTEMIGITASLIVTKKPNNYNKVELVLPDAPKATARPGPKRAEPGKAEAPVGITAPKRAARGDGTPVWPTWRTRHQAIKWAAQLKNGDGSPAYLATRDAEEVWEALSVSYESSVFEPLEKDFYRIWYRWHVCALEGKNFSFDDFPHEDDEPFMYAITGKRVP